MRATLLDRVSWDKVNARVRREQRNREVYVPAISLFRWWARRPHGLIGALIDAALDERPATVVSDPFSGGGTVAVEAARRGLALYAQDLHPWAIMGLASVLDRVDADILEAAAARVLERLEESCKDLYATTCPTHGDRSELVHVFWVRTSKCPACERTAYLYPYSLLTLASRRKDETTAFFGCSGCGWVSRQHVRAGTVRRCPSCRAVLAGADRSLLANRMVTCPAPCGRAFSAFNGATPAWEPVLVYRSCIDGGASIAHFDLPTAAETSAGCTVQVERPLNEAIPKGDETSLLRRAGFKQWADLYPPRQLVTLLAAADAVNALSAQLKVKARLRLAVCGAAEMAGFLSRWDRYYPKAFEAAANHRFAALGFTCETNLLARRGRGTIRRRFAQSIAAARWSHNHMMPRGTVRVTQASARRRDVAGPLLACGSSERQLPADGSIDLVLTDPPYFDDVQYAELASLFLVWARTLKLAPSTVSVDVSSEAVANVSRGTGVEEYRSLLTNIFIEARRTLKTRGRLVLTFHNTDIRAWWALSRALRAAGLRICALAVAEAENASDHSKRNRRAFTKDLVIECRARVSGIHLNILPHDGGAEADELRAAGRTVAGGGDLTLADFVDRFRTERGSLLAPWIEIPGTEG